MLEILTPMHGQILNAHCGRECGNTLTITVTGTARFADTVVVNGVEADRDGELFTAEIPLTRQFNEIVATASGNRGISERRISVVWDKASFRRVNFCIDDNVFFLADIAKERPASIFDHFYLKRLREIHEKWGLRLTLNLFYRDLRSDFTLAHFPDSYKAEWEANADWLKLAFHATAEFPDRPYQNAEAETLLAEYDRVYAEIRRFAGERVMIAPQNIHWSMCKPEAIPGLKERGIRFLGGLFINARTRIGESTGIPVCDVGYFLSEEDSRFLARHQLYYDFSTQMTYGTESIICNLEPMPELERKIDALIALPDVDALHMLTHEQYSFPFYQNYLPDHFDRIEKMAEKVVKAGYRFVFFSEGFAGNPSWGR